MYKDILINYYYSEEDKNKRSERLDYINNTYENEYLLKIINDTKTFAKYLLNYLEHCDTTYYNNVGYRTLVYDKKCLTNGCTLGGTCDWIIEVRLNDKLLCISKTLLKGVLPSSFVISFEQKEIDAFDEITSSGHSLYIDELNIVGPKEILDKECEQCKQM